MIMVVNNEEQEKEAVITQMFCFFNQVHAPEELKSREVIAFSYFFDRATERGLIGGW